MLGKSRYLLALVLLISAFPSLAQTDRSGAAPVTAPEFRLRIPISEPVPDRPGGPLPPGIRFAFPELVRNAGMIFSGTVTNIERAAALSGQVESVAITFHVERSIRGAVEGTDLTVSQWIGLWSSGQRYRVGERVLLFLYAPSRLGLTSCVAGAMGRFDVDAWGRVELSARHLAMLRKDPVLGGKSRVRFSDFALAVRRAGEEEARASGGDHEN